MPMLKFTLLDGAPIWINPDKVVAVQREERPLYGSERPREAGLGANIHIDVDRYWSVQDAADDVVAKIEQAKER